MAKMNWGKRGGTTVGAISAREMMDLLQSRPKGMPFNPVITVKQRQASYLGAKARKRDKAGRLDWPRPDGRNAVDEPKPTIIRTVKPPRHPRSS